MNAGAKTLLRCGAWIAVAAVCACYSTIPVLMGEFREMGRMMLCLSGPGVGPSMIILLAVLGLILTPVAVCFVVGWLQRRCDVTHGVLTRLLAALLSAVPLACIWIFNSESKALGMWIGVLMFFILMWLCVATSRVCRRKQVDTRCVWRGLLFGAAAGFLVFLSIDAPPIEHDYSWSDLPVPAKDVEASYNTLMQLRKGGEGLYIAIDDGDIIAMAAEGKTNVTVVTRQIKMAWQTSAPVRAVFEKLDEYDGIADLSRRIEDPLLNFLFVRRQMQVQCAHARLLMTHTNHIEAARQLRLVYSLACKRLPYSRWLVDKMIWIAMAKLAARTAFDCASDPLASPEALRVLYAAFKPLSNDAVSLRHTMIAEYCSIRDEWCSLRDEQSSTFFMNSVPLVRWVWYSPCTGLFYQRNRTVRLLRSSRDPLIAASSTAPPKSFDCEAFIRCLPTWSVRSCLGPWLLSISTPNMTEAWRKAGIVKVRSDLLAMYLASRIGESVELKDYYSGSTYLVDKTTGLPYSAGPDGKAGTDDDIRLDQQTW